ncbi:hypothetical protein ACN08P_10870 [Photobacterium leiognathi subsp. mandapamensis]|uniref:hypothetical protein n=1 Tax=Photobacterium leiognathi TaxID=553611 RepID=UPI003AF3431D
MISAITKSVLLPEHYRHHASAKAYQKENSDQIRYQIFNMHNHYLDRLDNTSQQYAINLSINSSCHKISSLFDPKVTLPSYLNEGEGFGKIYAFKRQRNYQDQGYKFIQLPSVEIGSRRCLPKDTVIDFFKDIDDYVNKHATRLKWTKVQLIDYYNACTYQLAFQFLILTGVRPTHALSLETQRCYGLKQAIHADKGRYRVIFLCNFLQQSIRDYLSLQKDILTQLKVETTSPYLWFLLDNKSQPLHLNAKMMRQFMQQHWPNKDKDNIDPYCLRHTFAQLALTAINKKENEHEHEHEHEREKELLLTPQQIDRLMGHSSFGEHLGSDYCFPPNRKILLAFLNSLPTELKFTLHSKRLENTNQSEEDDHEKPL